MIGGGNGISGMGFVDWEEGLVAGAEVLFILVVVSGIMG